MFDLEAYKIPSVFIDTVSVSSQINQAKEIMVRITLSEFIVGTETKVPRFVCVVTPLQAKDIGETILKHVAKMESKKDE